MPESFFTAELRRRLPGTLADVLNAMLSEVADEHVDYCLAEAPPGMGLGAGGRIRQEIYEDPWDLGDWELSQATRLWVHLCDAERWYQITGRVAPHAPALAEEYAAHGLPGFDYYLDDVMALKGSLTLAKLKSVFSLAGTAGDPTVAQEGPVAPAPVISLGKPRKMKVTEWDGGWNP